MKNTAATGNNSEIISAPQDGQVSTVSLTQGQNVVLDFNVDDVASMSLNDQGSLVVSFDNGTTLVIENAEYLFTDGASGQITFANGQSLDGFGLDAAPQMVEADIPMAPANEAQLNAESSSDAVTTIDRPSAGARDVVELASGQDYQLNFGQDEIQSLEQSGNEIIITFKDGGVLVMPNYGAEEDVLVLNESGAPFAPAEVQQFLALSEQLNDIETAAGGPTAGGAASGGGYGYNSSFAAQDFEGLNAIGVQDPTALSYGVGGVDDLDPLDDISPVDAPNIDIATQTLFEDGSITLDMNIQPQNGNESVTVQISGIDSSWAVDTSQSGGTYDASTGTWTISLPEGQGITQGPTLTPPADSDADLTNMTVTATSTQTDTGFTETATETFSVITDAVADTPTASAEDTSGAEDTAIGLDIDAALTDTDGSESITSVVISNMPAGAVLSAGTDNGDGSWTLSADDLNGLTITPPQDYSGSFDLDVTVNSAETNLSGGEVTTDNNTASTTTSLTVDVDAVPDSPSVSAGEVFVKEDGSAQMVVEASLSDTDGSEVLTVSVSGIEAGWTVDTSQSGGTYDAATGTWSLTLDQGETSYNGGPTLTPPADSDADMTGLTVSATATETSNGLSSTSQSTTSVYTDAVIDMPTLTAENASGAEDTAIDLDISPAVTDTDGSEEITGILISGVPEGASLSAGTDMGNGQWQLDPSDLNGLQLTPPQDYNGTFDLTVEATAREVNLSGAEQDTSDNMTTVTESLSVTVEPRADTPDLSSPALDSGEVTVKEDGSVALDMTATLTGPDTDVLTVEVSGIQDGWTVDTSQSGGTYNAATGTWSITLPAGENFSGGPTLMPPADSDVDMSGLTMTATAYDPSADISASSEGSFDVIVDAVADTPNLNASVDEVEQGRSVDLDISTSLTDTDGSEEITGIIVTGVPQGASLSAGTDIGNGRWELTMDDLDGLQLVTQDGITPGTYSLNVTATSEETDLAGEEADYSDNSASRTETLTLNVNRDDVPEIIGSDDPNNNPNTVQVDEDSFDSSDVLTASGTVEVDYKTDAPGSLSATGSDSFTSSTTLMSNGAAVTVALAGNTYTGTANGETVFDLTVNSDGSYTFNQYETLDHPDGSDHNDEISLSFGVTATDSDGDTATGNITVNVADDGVRADNDVNTFDAEATGSTTGNVITGENGGAGAADVVSNDEPNTITKVSFEGRSVDVPAEGTASIDGEYGHLEIASDGSYTYTLNEGVADGVEITKSHDFSTSTDFPELREGDRYTGDARGVADGDLTVDFATTGTVSYVDIGYSSASNSFGSYVIDPTTGELRSAQMMFENSKSISGGDQANFEIPEGGGQLGFFLINDGFDVNNGYSGVDFSSGSLSFVNTQTGETATINDRPQDIKLVYTDSNGNETTLGGSVYHTSTRGESSGLNPDGKVHVVSGGDDSDVLRIGFEDLPNLGDTDYEDFVFDVRVNDATVIGSADIQDQFTYELTDGDGDSDTANLTFNTEITKDEQPEITTTTNDGGISGVDEGSFDSTDTLTASGQIGVDYKNDGPGEVSGSGDFTSSTNLTSGGAGVNVTLSGDTYVGTANGETVFDLTVNSDGSYTFNQYATLDHPNGNNDNDQISLNFGVTATDADGDTANGNITVNVSDDGVQARSDVNTFNAETSSVATGNVITGENGGANAADDVSNDMPNTVTQVTFEGNAVNVPANGNATINGDYGRLEIAADGSYTYTLYDDVAAGDAEYGDLQDNFQYRLTDGDGDSSRANLTFDTTVEQNMQPEITATTNDGGISGVDEDGFDTSDTLTASGQIGVDYQGDGPGEVSGSGNFTSSTTLMSNGAAVTVALAGDTYTGTANGETVFDLTVNSDGSYTFNQYATLDHPNGNNDNDQISLNFGVTATDADGDTANGNITVNVSDDGVRADDDVNTFNSDIAPSTTGNVITGENGGAGADDVISNDNPNTITKVSFEGRSVDVPAEGTASIDGEYGHLEISSDGSYTYTLKDGVTDGVEVYKDHQFSNDVVFPDLQDGHRYSGPAQGVAEGDLSVSYGTTGRVYYKGEGASQSNSLGYYVADPDTGEIKSVHMMYENGNDTDWMSRVDFEIPEGGGQLGFFLIADGYDVNNGYSGMDFSEGQLSFVKGRTDQPATIHDSASEMNLFYTLPNGLRTEIGGQVYHTTTRGGSTDINPDGKVHVVSGGYENRDDVLRIGFEDLNNLGDQDYEDIYFDVYINSATVTEGADIQDQFTYELTDGDGDHDSANLTFNTSVSKDETPEIVAINGEDGQLFVDESMFRTENTLTTEGQVEVDYKGDGPGEVSGSGDFNSSINLTSNGAAVTVALVGNTYTGTANGQTVFDLTVNSDGSYTFNQYATLDHADPSTVNIYDNDNASNQITLDFGITAQDADGDTAGGTISVKVYDDAARADSDVNTFDSNVSSSTTGNVITGENGGFQADDLLSEDTPNMITKVSFEGRSVDVPAEGTASIDGEYGRLEIASDGSYTYTLNDGVTDGVPVTHSHEFSNSVDFPDLDDGDYYNGAARGIAEGDLSVDYGTYGGVTYVSEGAGRTNSLGSYVVDPETGEIHSAQMIFENGETPLYGHGSRFQIPEGGGDLGLFLISDGYDVNNGYSGIDFSEGSLSFVNTRTGETATVNDNAQDIKLVYTDAQGHETTLNGAVYHTTTRGGSANLNPDGKVHVVSGSVDGQDDVLRIGFEDLPNLGDTDYEDIVVDVRVYNSTKIESADIQDQFTYELTDGDGDSDTANLTFNTEVTEDMAPEITATTNDGGISGVDEDGFDTADTLTASGQIGVDYQGDGPGEVSGSGNFTSSTTLMSNGAAVTVALSGDTYTGTANGETVFDLTVNSDGSYTFNQYATLDHPNGNNDNDQISLNFGVTATDADGDTANGNITVNVSDDGVRADDDVNTFNSDIAPSTTGNVITGENGGAGADDVISNDNPNTITKVSFEGRSVDVPAEGTASIDGEYGHLEIASDGSYTYTLKDDVQNGVEVPVQHQFDGSVDFPNLKSGRVYNGTEPKGVLESDMTVDYGTTVTTTFLSEGAGRSNSFGSYYIDPDTGEFRSAKMMHVNSNNIPYGAEDSFELPEGGAQMGFFLLSEGYDVNNAYRGIDFSKGNLLFLNKNTGATATINDDAGDIQLAFRGANGSLTNFAGNVYHTTTRDGDLNDLNHDNLHHVVSGAPTNGEKDVLRISFEDLPNLGDSDFEDFIFDVRVGGGTAIADSAQIEDQFTYELTDGDGDSDTANLTFNTEVSKDETPEITTSNSYDLWLDETNFDTNDVLTASGQVDVDYKGDGPGTVSGNGEFESYNLTSHGAAVTVALVNGTYVGTANGNTVFEMDIEPNGEYTFKQYDTLDHHTKGGYHNDSAVLKFGVSATDADGDTANDMISVRILDDGPEARIVKDNFDSDVSMTSEGNVLTNNGLSNDMPNTITGITYKGERVDVPENGTATVDGKYGSMEISSDGSYTYTLYPETMDGYEYTQSHKFYSQIAFPDLDDGDYYNGEALRVRSSDMEVGYKTSGTATFVSEGASKANSLGSYIVDPSSGEIKMASMMFENGESTRAGDTARFDIPEGGGNMGFFLIADGYDVNNGYSGIDFSQGNLAFINRHTGENATIRDSASDIRLVYTDENGHETTLGGSIYHTTSYASGTNLNPDGDVHVVSGVQNYNRDTLRIGFEDLNNLGDTDYEDMVFDITVDPADFTKYGNIYDTFRYEMTDGDGDTDESFLAMQTSISEDMQPEIIPNSNGQEVSTSEHMFGLYDTLTLTSEMRVDYHGDGQGEMTPTGASSFTSSVPLTSGGMAVTVMLIDNMYVGKANGETIFDLTVNTDNTFTFNQYATLDHPDTTQDHDVINMSFGITATDADGDATQGAIRVKVTDDGPEADRDLNVFDAGVSNVTSGNVITGENGGWFAEDELSQDTPHSVTKVSFDGQWHDVPENGTTTVAGRYGTLEIGSDGSYSYNLDTSVMDGFEVPAEHNFWGREYFPNLSSGDAYTRTNALGIRESDVTIDYGTTGSVTFLSETAGRSNSFGYYMIDPDTGEISSTHLMFENGNNIARNTSKEFTIPKGGAQLGFFVVSDGYDYNNAYRNIDFSEGELKFVQWRTGEPATINNRAEDIKLMYVDANGHETEINGPVYHSSFRGDTPVMNADDKVHVVSGSTHYGDPDVLRISFEDLPNLGDTDYDDFMFDLRINDGTKFISEGQLQDQFQYELTDGDGDTDVTNLIMQTNIDADGAINEVHSFTGTETDGDVGSAGTVDMITAVTFNNHAVSVPEHGQAEIEGEYGTLKIAANGDFEYIANGQPAPEGQESTDVFEYTVQNADGDQDTAYLALNRDTDADAEVYIGQDGQQDHFSIGADDGVDLIVGYNGEEGDVVDISDVLSGYDPMSDALSDFVQVDVVNDNANVKVNSNGSANGTFETVAVLHDVTDINIDDLMTHTDGNV